MDSTDVCAKEFNWRSVVHISPFVQREKFNAARFELHQLLSHASLIGVPLLVVRFSFYALLSNVPTFFQLGNKNDLEDHAPIKELIPALYVLDLCADIHTLIFGFGQSTG